jgi:CubicO group peptidase (beta-lactamase class C family)
MWLAQRTPFGQAHQINQPHSINMVYKKLIISLLHLIFAITQLTGQVINDEQKLLLDATLFGKEIRSNKPGYYACVVQNGQIIYEAAVGMANVEQHIPIRSNTIFNIGSMAKQFMAISILLLEEEGRLRLDDPIHKYLPELPDYGHPVTIAHLMSHTSGIRDHIELMIMHNKFKWRKADLRHLFEYQQKIKTLNFEPGTDFAYCNTGYMMLAAIVERVSGQPMREFAQARIFGPLGMKTARFEGGFFVEMPDRTRSYEFVGNRFKAVNRQHDIIGATGVHCSALDLVRWEQNFYDNRLGKGGPALIERMQTVIPFSDGSSSGYAGGLFIRKYRGYQEIEHSGGYGYYMTQGRRFPELGISVIVLCNNSVDSPFAINEAICDIVVPYPPTPPLWSGSVPAGIPLDSLDGLYLSHNNWLRQVAHTDSSLYIVLSGKRIHLKYRSSTPQSIVMHDSAGNEVNFNVQKNNRVTGMSWTNGSYFNGRRYYQKMPESPHFRVSTLAGRYRQSDMGKRVRIKYNRRTQKLYLVPFPLVKYRLVHVADHVFKLDEGGYLLRFEGDSFFMGDTWNQNLRFDKR